MDRSHVQPFPIDRSTYQVPYKETQDAAQNEKNNPPSASSHDHMEQQSQHGGEDEADQISR